MKRYTEELRDKQGESQVLAEAEEPNSYSRGWYDGQAHAYLVAVQMFADWLDRGGLSEG